ncbi:hypothetical protein HYV73_04720 [Candidatus Uhrbacteria bacterium]|nr:hypothetical protein [Candidatus Uhrbacteria bacterium]
MPVETEIENIIEMLLFELTFADLAIFFLKEPDRYLSDYCKENAIAPFLRQEVLFGLVSHVHKLFDDKTKKGMSLHQLGIRLRSAKFSYSETFWTEKGRLEEIYKERIGLFETIRHQVVAHRSIKPESLDNWTTLISDKLTADLMLDFRYLLAVTRKEMFQRKHG